MSTMKLKDILNETNEYADALPHTKEVDPENLDETILLNEDFGITALAVMSGVVGGHLINKLIDKAEPKIKKHVDKIKTSLKTARRDANIAKAEKIGSKLAKDSDIKALSSELSNGWDEAGLKKLDNLISKKLSSSERKLLSLISNDVYGRIRSSNYNELEESTGCGCGCGCGGTKKLSEGIGDTIVYVRKRAGGKPEMYGEYTSSKEAEKVSDKLFFSGKYNDVGLTSKEGWKNMKAGGIKEASTRRSEDFFDEYKHGKEIRKMLKGTWNASKVERYLDTIGGGSDTKWVRVMEIMARRLGLNPKRYDNRPTGDMIDDILDKMEKLYDIHISESVNEISSLDLRRKAGQPPAGTDLRQSGDTNYVFYHSKDPKSSKYADKVAKIDRKAILMDLDKKRESVNEVKVKDVEELFTDIEMYGSARAKSKVQSLVSKVGTGDSDSLYDLSGTELDRLYKDLQKIANKENISVNEAVQPSKVIEKIKQVVDEKQRQRIDNTMIDLTTAGMIMQIYNQANDRVKAKMNKLSPVQLVNVAFKIFK